MSLDTGVQKGSDGAKWAADLGGWPAADREAT